MKTRFAGTEMVVFDLDGTLVDTASFAVGAQQRAFRDLGIAEPSAVAIRAAFGTSAGDFYASLLAPYDESLAAELHRVAMRRQRETLARGEGRTFAGVPELLDALVTSGRTVGFCSNGSPEYVGLLIETFAFHRYGLWRDVTAMGPERSKMNGIADLMRAARADRAVVVGDRRWDIEAAHALGLPAIACRWGFGSSDELASADLIVESIEALADALDVPHCISRREGK